MFSQLRAIFFGFIFLLVATSTGLATVVPQLVIGGGYDLVILATNKTGSVKSVEFVLLEGYGQPWSVPFSVNGEIGQDNRIQVTLAANSVQKLRLTGGDTPHAGYLRFEQNATFPGLVVPITTQFFYEYRQRGELIDSIAAPAGSATFGSSSLVFPVERSASLNTGFALAPWGIPDGSRPAIPYTLRLYDQYGFQLGVKSFTFDGHTALFFDELFPEVPEDFLGWLSLEVSSANFMQHLCVTVLRQVRTPRGFQLTNIQPDFGALQTPWPFGF